MSGILINTPLEGTVHLRAPNSSANSVLRLPEGNGTLLSTDYTTGIFEELIYDRYAPSPYTIGQPLGGGFYAGRISTTGDGVPTHYLIVSPKASGEALLQWKTTNTTTAGTGSLIDGPANSAAMNNADHPAAQFCEGLSIGGYTDWYMPARNELEVIYYHLKNVSQSNWLSSGNLGINANAVFPERLNTQYTASVPAQTSATAFIVGGTEAFVDNGYWSSSENEATYAWTQYFTSGYPGSQGYNTKTGSDCVRAVRRLAI